MTVDKEGEYPFVVKADDGTEYDFVVKYENGSAEIVGQELDYTIGIK